MTYEETLATYQTEHLDQERQHELIRIVQNGTTIKEVPIHEEGDEDTQTPDKDDGRIKETRTVKKRTDRAQDALEQIVRSNLNLVARFVSDITNTLNEQAIQQGVMGLIEAIDRFDRDQNVRLSSYAFFWIKRYIIRFHNQNVKTSRSVNDNKLLTQIRDAKKELYKKQKEVSPENVARHLNESIDRIRTVWMSDHQSRSLNEDGEGREVRPLNQKVHSGSSSPVFEEIFRIEIIHKLYENIQNELTDREAYIVRNYYDLDDDAGCTHREIGEKMDLSKERIRQLLEQAKHKLKDAFQQDGIECLPDFLTKKCNRRSTVKDPGVANKK